MGLGPDDIICFCFHVSLRKVENFCRTNRPKVASQISECLSAGTGCGWCRPTLRRIHARICSPTVSNAAPNLDLTSPSPDTASAEAYAAGRQQYLAARRREGITQKGPNE